MGPAFAVFCSAAWSGAPTPITSAPGFWLSILLSPFLLCRAQSRNADSWLGSSNPHKIFSFPHLPGPWWSFFMSAAIAPKDMEFYNLLKPWLGE